VKEEEVGVVLEEEVEEEEGEEEVEEHLEAEAVSEEEQLKAVSEEEQLKAGVVALFKLRERMYLKEAVTEDVLPEEAV
jgi:hypothetical protein